MVVDITSDRQHGTRVSQHEDDEGDREVLCHQQEISNNLVGQHNRPVLVLPSPLVAVVVFLLQLRVPAAEIARLETGKT